LISAFSLYYLLKKRQSNASHVIVTGFTILITAFNVAVFCLKAATIVLSIQATICPMFAEQMAITQVTFQLESLNSWLGNNQVRDNRFFKISLSLVPVFLWVTDAFLVSQYDHHLAYVHRTELDH
jgi:hypothetical protein